jgi:carbonic anhydrase
MVVNTDSNLMSAIQYGVGYLGVKHIIICGHYECGGVRAAEVHNDFVAPLELWLRNIRDVYATHRVELDAIEDADVRHRRLVDLNVIQQAVNVMKTEPVQAKRKETYADGEAYISPLIHAMVFDPKSGVLKRLDVDFKKYEKELASVYGLYTI